MIFYCDIIDIYHRKGSIVMKGKSSVKLIAAALALVICLVPVLTVFSAAKAPVKVPTINVHGLMASDVYVDADDPDSDVVWPPSTDAILNAVKDALPGIAKFAVTRNWEAFGVDITNVVNPLFEPAACNPDGTPVGNSGVRFTYPSPEEINKIISDDDEINFRYDWRIDPIVVAGQLNDFIDYVLECSGSETVKITCHSLGGLITDTYLTVYGDDKVSALCMNSTAVLGETYTGELLTGQIIFDPDALQYFLSFVFDPLEYTELLDSVVEILKQAGLLDFVTDFANTLVEHDLLQVSRDCLLPLFGSWPSIWAMVNDDAIDAAEHYVFDIAYEGQDFSGLQNTIHAYNERIRPYRIDTLKNYNEKASLYIVSRYGYPSIPLTPSALSVSDGVIDTKYTSYGATVAPYGSTLPESTVAGVAPEYISPDKTVDASTCLFPEQTWFIKGMQHAKNYDALCDMMTTLLNYDGQATVDTFEEYPRFTVYDYATDIISPDPGPSPALSLPEKLIVIVKELVTLIVNLVSGLINR